VSRTLRDGVQSRPGVNRAPGDVRQRLADKLLQGERRAASAAAAGEQLGGGQRRSHIARQDCGNAGLHPSYSEIWAVGVQAIIDTKGPTFRFNGLAEASRQVRCNRLLGSLFALYISLHVFTHIMQEGWQMWQEEETIYSLLAVHGIVRRHNI
jgi:hypothetical protein